MMKHCKVYVDTLPDSEITTDSSIIFIVPKRSNVSPEMVQIAEQIYQIDFQSHLNWLLEQIRDEFDQVDVISSSTQFIDLFIN